ncbi:MAG: hypothetical protein LKI03_09680 [Acetobacter indonesiensis]|nr:hypothetical protein [Acetobacter indonesiensis]MCI1546951.1 hypothetical protein [Acetobacter indonesiensis]MCI1766300.1 hypothetical protein [Acetobacter indonesiensis]
METSDSSPHKGETPANVNATPSPALPQEKAGSQNSSANSSAPGFDGPTTPPLSRATPKPPPVQTVTPDEIKDALEEAKEIRFLRRCLFMGFLVISGLELLFLPCAIIYMLRTEEYIDVVSQDNSRAMIASGLMVALAGAIPLTIFVTLAKMIHKNEAAKSENNQEQKLTTALTSLFSALSDTVTKIKDICGK